ncbi:MAG TPA: gamma-glutamylcyclotransferase family protein [Sphingobium sp.]
MTEKIPVFVYGTLLPGQPGFDELELGPRVDLLGKARVAGTLYDLGDYPGAVLGGAGLIVGELLMPLDAGVLALLDEFEMFDPADHASSEYLRLRSNIVSSDLNAWIYVYNFPLKQASLIPSGDWTQLG